MEDFHSLSNRISGLQEDIFAVKRMTKKAKNSRFELLF